MTTDKSFEEEFPELKGKGLYDFPDIDLSIEEFNEDLKKLSTYHFMDPDYHNQKPKTEDDVSVYRKDLIQEHCLSKQRVKDAIYNVCSTGMNMTQIKERLKIERLLLKELGLDKEE